MKPRIDRTEFGSITIAGETYEHDVIIRLDGGVEKRKKKLSKQIFGPSHIISLAEAVHIYETGARWIVIGTGQSGMVRLSDEAAEFFRKNGCQVKALATPEAIHCWDDSEEPVVGTAEAWKLCQARILLIPMLSCSEAQNFENRVVP